MKNIFKREDINKTDILSFVVIFMEMMFGEILYFYPEILIKIPQFHLGVDEALCHAKHAMMAIG